MAFFIILGAIFISVLIANDALKKPDTDVEFNAIFE